MNGTTYNFILDTDAYKLGSHWAMYPKNLDFITSYGECRNGSEYDELVFAGLRPIIGQITGVVVTPEKINEAYGYFNPDEQKLFNYAGWMKIATELHGKLPIEIKALKEGTKIGKSQAMMQISNTVKGFAWLVGDIETMISRVWLPIAVASKANKIKNLFKKYFEATTEEGASHWLVDYMLQDFGARSATSYDHSGMYGVMHKLIFEGTDTIAAAKFAVDFYNADPQKIMSFIPASEHSVMTINGREGEEEVFSRLLETFPTGILSIVDDSYNEQNFTTVFAAKYKDVILARDGKTVFRPDSGDPTEVTLRQMQNLADVFGYTTNALGYKELNPKVGLLWGDGIDIDGIEKILEALRANGWAVSNMIFGMGSSLCQRLNRDTIAWAFKACAALFEGDYEIVTDGSFNSDSVHIDYVINAKWRDVYKDPVGAGATSSFTKASKRGVQMVIKQWEEYKTVRADMYPNFKDYLNTVFRDGDDFYTEDDDWDACVTRARA